ncbi:hypothetical protein MAE02_62820 [Microvirga aerophila]|uniref:Uncharacterized protein n=1 Tax=Microvirga aerophila TaxID=670291 RepID=A0A512C2Z3_9HYPH|nr:hypothetical protein MAE02_62820 [Microvirga aerophila]
MSDPLGFHLCPRERGGTSWIRLFVRCSKTESVGSRVGVSLINARFTPFIFSTPLSALSEEALKVTTRTDTVEKLEQAADEALEDLSALLLEAADTILMLRELLVDQDGL